MIVQKKIDINGRPFTHTTSDENRFIVRDGMQFEDAYDPTEFGRAYTEGDKIVHYPESAEVLEEIITRCAEVTMEDAHRIRRLIERAAAYLDDGDALDGIELFPVWEPDTDYEDRKRLRHGAQLWRTRQAHRSQAAYPPSIYTASLYEIVERPGEGDTPSNPIHYKGNMALKNGKYYEQDGVVYRCIRDTINPVYEPLRNLVEIYVEEVAAV